MYILKAVVNSPWQIIQNIKANKQTNKQNTHTKFTELYPTQGFISVVVNSTLIS
jgi:hypothetical protein